MPKDEIPDFPMNSFTPRAQQVLSLAKEEAKRFGHDYVGTEHLLLGLIKLGQGIAVAVLQAMNLDLERRTLINFSVAVWRCSSCQHAPGAFFYVPCKESPTDCTQVDKGCGIKEIRGYPL